MLASLSDWRWCSFLNLFFVSTSSLSLSPSHPLHTHLFLSSPLICILPSPSTLPSLVFLPQLRHLHPHHHVKKIIKSSGVFCISFEDDLCSKRKRSLSCDRFEVKNTPPVCNDPPDHHQSRRRSRCQRFYNHRWSDGGAPGNTSTLRAASAPFGEGRVRLGGGGEEGEKRQGGAKSSCHAFARHRRVTIVRRPPVDVSSSHSAGR